MVCFSIILHTFANMRSKNPSCHDNQYSASLHKKTANENRWGAHAVLLWPHAGWGAVFLHLWYAKRTVPLVCKTKINDE